MKHTNSSKSDDSPTVSGANDSAVSLAVAASSTVLPSKTEVANANVDPSPISNRRIASIEKNR